ncbi:hypothetical protein L596_008803 [Steinernema carpocapsae]|uniref:Uncharacterized protein n=1 Tax=Steinernema carpocapsae TaxID=34508 RepID=A0A4U5PDJ2_STECR|nr:hypothetical protein L596_008803 [Steinernema carpocapsae]
MSRPRIAFGSHQFVPISLVVEVPALRCCDGKHRHHVIGPPPHHHPANGQGHQARANGHPPPQRLVNGQVQQARVPGQGQQARVDVDRIRKRPLRPASPHFADAKKRFAPSNSREAPHVQASLRPSR